MLSSGSIWEDEKNPGRAALRAFAAPSSDGGSADGRDGQCELLGASQTAHPAFTAVTGHEGGILASICGIFGSRMAQKRLKMGQNRRVPVTHQITR